jgi:hypothetical protein
MVAPNPSVVGQPVTVNFSVAPQASNPNTPSGTVTINASTGENCTGSAPTGSCSLTFATAGPRTITASYGGDANFAGSTSLGVSQSVGDFTITVAPPSETIPSGHAAHYAISLTALGGLTGSVSLGCGGNPPHSTCAITPSSVMLNGTGAAKITLFPPKNVNHGTFTLTFTGIFGSGIPATGGLTHSTSASLKVK